MEPDLFFRRFASFFLSLRVCFAACLNSVSIILFIVLSVALLSLGPWQLSGLFLALLLHVIVLL